MYVLYNAICYYVERIAHVVWESAVIYYLRIQSALDKIVNYHLPNWEKNIKIFQGIVFYPTKPEKYSKLQGFVIGEYTIFRIEKKIGILEFLINLLWCVMT